MKRNYGILCLTLLILLFLNACATNNPELSSSAASSNLPTESKSATAPTQSSAQPTSQESQTIKSGCLFFENERISFQFPERYAEWSQRTKDDPDIRALIKNKLTESSDEGMAQALDKFMLTLYDFQERQQDYDPLITFRIEDMPGVDMKYFSEGSGVSDIKNAVEGQYTKLMWHMEPRLKSFSGTEFLVYRNEVEQGEVMMAMYQAVHIWDETIMYITVGMPADMMKDTTVAEIEDILKTMRFS